MKFLHAVSALTLSVVASACGGEATTAPSGSPSSKPATAASSKASAAPAAVSAAPAAASAAPAAPSGDLVELDLSPGGAAYKGLKAKGPAGTKIADDGAGSVGIAMNGGTQITLGSDVKLIKDIKSGAEAGAKAVEGKITFTNDKADTLDYVTELKDIEGKDAKLWGFAHTLDIGGKKYLCSASVDSEAALAAADAFCKSVTK